MRRILASVCMSVLAIAGSESHAQQDFDREELLDKLSAKLRVARHMAFHPVIIRAVQSQNNEGLTMEVIRERDSEWRSAQGETALQRSLLRSEASKLLQTLVERNPDFNEAFATDNQGANVAMFPTTSDYWQGDEDKWVRSFNNGAGSVYVGEIELDESTNTFAVQVSVPIMDQGEAIGVLVTGVTQAYLQE